MSNKKLHTMISLPSQYTYPNVVNVGIEDGSIDIDDIATIGPESFKKRIDILEKQLMGYKLKTQELESSIKDLEAGITELVGLLSTKIDKNYFNIQMSNLENKVNYNNSAICELNDDIKNLKI